MKSYPNARSGLCHYIWETFPYVNSPTLVLAYYYAHYILTNFALLEYPVLEYVSTKSEGIQSEL
jgi:hypothetical protein